MNFKKKKTKCDLLQIGDYTPLSDNKFFTSFHSNKFLVNPRLVVGRTV